MTLQELNSYFEILTRINKAKEILTALQNAALPAARVLDGMPRSPGVKDKVGDKAAEIVDIEHKIALLEREAEQTKEKIAAFIDSIEDELLRIIFRLRFQRGLTWQEVTDVLGRKYTPEGVRTAAYRYLKKTA